MLHGFVLLLIYCEKLYCIFSDNLFSCICMINKYYSDDLIGLFYACNFSTIKKKNTLLQNIIYF